MSVILDNWSLAPSSAKVELGKAAREFEDTMRRAKGASSSAKARKKRLYKRNQLIKKLRKSGKLTHLIANDDKVIQLNSGRRMKEKQVCRIAPSRRASKINIRAK
jgi:hypothetical protein